MQMRARISHRSSAARENVDIISTSSISTSLNQSKWRLIILSIRAEVGCLNALLPSRCLLCAPFLLRWARASSSSFFSFVFVIGR